MVTGFGRKRQYFRSIWLRCAKCKRLDKTRRAIVDGRLRHVTGTYKTMKCRDCAHGRDEERASFCRLCCPSEHQTKLVFLLLEGTR